MSQKQASGHKRYVHDLKGNAGIRALWRRPENCHLGRNDAPQVCIWGAVHWICARPAKQAHCQSPVGGGLPPIAEWQAIDVLAEPPPSGASPLPHWIRVRPTKQAHRQLPHWIRARPAKQAHRQSPVGGGLPPIAEWQAIDVLAEPPPSGASPLAHWIRVRPAKQAYRQLPHFTQ